MRVNYKRLLENYMQLAGIQFKREKKFHPERKWAFDYWIFGYKGKSIKPSLPVAVEYEGGTWGNSGKSRHTTGKGFRDDCIKYSWANILGWCVIQCTADMVVSGEAINLILEAIKERALT